MFNNSQTTFGGTYNNTQSFQTATGFGGGQQPVGSAPTYNQPYSGYGYGNQTYGSPNNAGANLQMQSQQIINQQDLQGVLRGFDLLMGTEVPKYHQALLISREKGKTEVTKYFNELHQNNEKMRAHDNNRYQMVSKQCEEIQQRNDEICKELLRVQDDIVRTSSNTGRVNRQPDWEAELYRRVSELKRVFAEVDRKLYDIQMIGKPEQPEVLEVEKPLKELEHAIQILAVETSRKRVECDLLVKTMQS